MLLDWFNGARWRISLSHSLEGLIIQIPVTALFGPWTGAVSVVIWYWGRKKLEMELKSLKDGDSHVYSWAEGWLPWHWPAYYILDVALPGITSFLLAYLLTIIPMRF